MSALRITQIEQPSDAPGRSTSTGRERPVIDPVLAVLRVDFPPERHEPPRFRLALATVVSIVGSLVADAVVVALGTALFPATRGYVHFRFTDYGKLTVVGVVVACVAWPIVTRISSAPRWLFLRLAVVVTLVLLLPDIFILWKGQPARAVAVLMVMHLAIALVTYNALVRLAPARRRSRKPDRQTAP